MGPEPPQPEVGSTYTLGPQAVLVYVDGAPGIQCVQKFSIIAKPPRSAFGALGAQVSSPVSQLWGFTVAFNHGTLKQGKSQ